jgi:hypothetical protein
MFLIAGNDGQRLGWIRYEQGVGMIRWSMRFVTPFVFVLGILGCNQGPSGATGQVNIGQTSCVYCSIGNSDRLALVVWLDEPDRNPIRAIGGAAPFHGEFRLKSGNRLSWSCSSRDGKTGNVEIAGRSFDLQKGGLFLISGGGAQVEQLPIETVGGTLGAAGEKLNSLAKTDPKISAFVNAAKGK